MYIKLLKKWQHNLDLNDWSIDVQPIEREQVTYPDDIGEDKYYIGIATNYQKKTGTTYHDVPLYEEAIVHELLHVKYPDQSEDWVNTISSIITKLN